MCFCVEKARIEALKGKIYNFSENNENHRVYPSACGKKNLNIMTIYQDNH